MSVREVNVKRWGGSLGVVIPSEVVKELRLRPGRKVRVDFEPRQRRVEDIVGLFREELKGMDWKKVDRELATGWDD